MLGEQPDRSSRPWVTAQRSWPRSIAAGESGSVAEARRHGPPSPVPEAVLEQQLEVAVVGREHAVVERLAVVGVGAGVEQQPGERERVRVAGLARRARSPPPNTPVSTVNGVGRPSQR